MTNSPDTSKKLTQKYKIMRKLSRSFFGYPCNADFNYKQLYPFLEMPLNNVGDAYQSSNYQLNTHDFEQEVIAYVAKLMGVETKPNDPQDYWGYISNGGSEGNICGIHYARNLFPEGRVYYSTHSHYSIEKGVRITRSDSCQIPVQITGEIDYTELEKSLNKHCNQPAIIIANVGTTMTGAIDEVEKIKTLLAKLNITQYYIHADCALHGLILPFCKGPKSISLNEVDSLSISGHKFIGSPLPCGIFLTKPSIVEKQQQYIEYVDIHDNTISGSRNAITPLILWYALRSKGELKLQKMVDRCMSHTSYALEHLKEHGIDAWVNPQSNIVNFPTPGEAVVKKWQLAVYNGSAHIVVMPHVSKKMIHAFIEDFIDDAKGKPIKSLHYEGLNPFENPRAAKGWSTIGGMLLASFGVLAFSVFD